MSFLDHNGVPFNSGGAGVPGPIRIAEQHGQSQRCGSKRVLLDHGETYGSYQPALRLAGRKDQRQRRLVSIGAKRAADLRPAENASAVATAALAGAVAAFYLMVWIDVQKPIHTLVAATRADQRD